MHPKPHTARYGYVAVLEMILFRGTNVFREDYHCHQTCLKATANSTRISWQTSPWRGNVCKHKVMSQSELVSYRKGFILNNKLHRSLEGGSLLPFLLGIHWLHQAILSTHRGRNKEDIFLLWGWWAPGTGCPENLWLLHLWKCPRPVWTGLGEQPGIVERSPTDGRDLEQDVPEGLFQSKLFWYSEVFYCSIGYYC